MKKEQQVYVLAGIVLIFAAFVYYKLLLGPVNASISEKKENIVKMKQELDTAKKEAARIDEFIQKSERLNDELKELQKSLPKAKDVPDLLRILTKDARKFGINVSKVNPGGAVNKQEYNELPYSLALTANFHTLGDFLAEIGQEERLLSVRNINLNSTGGKGMTTIGVSLTMVAYMAK